MYIPQYNAENSVTNRLVKQLKKAGQNHFNILLTDVHQHQQLQQLERVPNALGAEEFLLRQFHDSNEHRMPKGWQNPSTDRCRSLLILKMSNATLHTAKMSIFHFQEKNFASYDEIVDSDSEKPVLTVDTSHK